MKMMLQQQLKNLPTDVQEKIMTAFTNNPDFFKKIAEEIQAKVKAGQSQMSAAQQVMLAHKRELQEMLQK